MSLNVRSEFEHATIVTPDRFPVSSIFRIELKTNGSIPVSQNGLRYSISPSELYKFNKLQTLENCLKSVRLYRKELFSFDVEIEV